VYWNAINVIKMSLTEIPTRKEKFFENFSTFLKDENRGNESC
jgi:hypothetical protein